MRACMHSSPAPVIECAQVAVVVSVSDRMMLVEAMHINPIHICEA